MPKLADIYTCTGCLACVDSCAKGALRSYYNDEGHLTFSFDTSSCIDCGLCEKVCPVISDFLYGENVLCKSTPFAAWSCDDLLRAKSSSGGVFATLAKHIISQSGVAIGASLYHNEVRHVVIDTVEDIYKLQGSKYTQSDTAGIYRAAKEYLQNGQNVLFSGLGCQIAGLLSYLGDKEYKGELYTVDLICGGVPTRFLIDRYLKENPNVSEIIAFRNKAKYEFSVKDKNDQVRVVPLSQRPFPLCGFYTELTNRYSCYDCRFNGTHRKSDITIGDYWGDTEFPEEHQNGISVAVAHSDKGKMLLAQANIETHEIEWENFLMHNPRMMDGHKSASQSNARKNLAKAFKEYSYEKLLQVYANKATWHEPWLMIKKIWRYMMGRLKGKTYRKQLRVRIHNLTEK